MKKRMTKAEMLERRSALSDRRNEILEEVDKDERELTDEEVAELEKIRNEIALLTARLEELEAKRVEKEKELNSDSEDDDEPAGRSMMRIRMGEDRSRTLNPLTQLIRGAMGSPMSDEVRSMSESAKRNHRLATGGANENGVYIPLTERRDVLQAGKDTLGKETVATDILNILDPLREQLVLNRAGATMLTGLVGNLQIPSYSGSKSAWVGEIEKAPEGNGVFDGKLLSPKRLATTLNVSRQLLLQDSAGVEAMLKRDLVASIRTKLEQTVFGSEAATATRPAGIFSKTISNKGAASYDRIVDMFAALRNRLVLSDGVKAITNPTGHAILAKTPLHASGFMGFLATTDKIATGHDLLVTTAVATKGGEEGIVIANWHDFIVAQWGALEVKVDDTTRFDEGIVRLMINSYWDFGFRDEDSYEVATIKMAAATPGA